MVVEASDVELHFTSAWKYSERDDRDDYETLGTYTGEMEDADGDLIDLLKQNMVRAFNAKEKHMNGGIPDTSSCPMRAEEYQTRKKRPHAFMMAFEGQINTPVRDHLDTLKGVDIGDNGNEEEIDEATEELARGYYSSQNWDNQGVLFSMRIYVPEIGTDFICIFITDIDDRKFTAASEKEVVERIKESFDSDIPKRIVYPFYDLEDESVINEVKIWESGGELANYYINAFDLEELEDTNSKVFDGLEGGPYSPNQLIDRGEDNGLTREQAENVELELEVAGKSVKLTLSDLRDEKVRIYRNERGENHVIIKGEIEMSEEEEEELESLEGVFLEGEDELQEHFE